MVLDNLKPEKVFKFFEEISNIPRGSGNEKAASDFLVQFAKDRELSCFQDEAYNVIIKKPASPGYENSKPVILQGHIDMVCEKNSDVEHDFLKDPIKITVDGDLVKADGTTLGGDNGIAIAIMMAILDSNNLKHPFLETVFTTEEEIGLIGASKIDASNLTGKYMINIDSEEEGVFLTSCAGGMRVDLISKIEKQNPNLDDYVVSLFVKGFFGGHSGGDIILGRGNSIVCLGRTLNQLLKNFSFDIFSLNGGSKDNAIPREAEALLTINKNDFDKFILAVKNFEEIVRSEYYGIENDFNIVVEILDKKTDFVFKKDYAKKIINALIALPNGVSSMSKDIDGLVETSNNLGVLITNKEEVIISGSLRSSVESRRDMLLEKFIAIGELINAKIDKRGIYPGWAYTQNSKIREICKDTYKELTGKDAFLNAIHAGVECGIFKDKIKDLDIVSLGPNAFNAHTPLESFSISSLQTVYELILKVLEKLK